MKSIKIHIISDDCFYSYGLQEYLYLFFSKRGFDTSFGFGDEINMSYVPDIIIRNFIRGEIYACQKELNFNGDNIIIGITDQEYFVRDLPNCLKGMKVINYRTTLAELQKILEYIVSVKMKHELKNNLFKFIGCYNCKSIKLSTQEINILEKLLAGDSYAEIVKKLEITIKTFYTHKYNISRKFGLRRDSDFVQLIRKPVIYR